jgi:DNA adenine methylase
MLTKLSKAELLLKCEELKITKYKSKNKSELINLINIKNLNYTINVSPLRYPGGKTRACKIINNIIVENFNINNFNTLISPFFGGGSFEFYFQNTHNVKLIVNDKFKPLYNFWKQIKEDKDALCKELRQIKIVTKEQFTNYRKTIMDLNNDTLNQSILYFIINRCSFSGSTLSGGFSEEASKKRYTPSSISKIELLNFSNVEIYNEDFKDFLRETLLIRDNSLMYLDPPYYLEKNSKLYGNNGDMHENFDHQSLFNLLKLQKNWIITYNNCDYIKNLYKDYLILDVNWSYSMNKSKTSSEIVIICK